ncbi:MAG: two-component regulator propeller domain-containing protein [Marinilabilia sp.]
MLSVSIQRFVFLGFCLLLPRLLFGASDETGESYKFRHLTVSDGLSNNQITSVHKDRHGFIWFGTVSGLNRYDGHSFKVYKNIPDDPTTIPFNNVENIYEDYRGCLWVLSQDNSYTVYDPRTNEFSRDYDLFTGRDSIPAEYVSGVEIAGNEAMWVSTSQYGVFRVGIASQNIERFHSGGDSSASLADDVVTDIELAGDSSVVIINAFGVLEELDPRTGEVKNRIHPESLSSVEDPDYFALFIDESGDYWIYSEQKDRGLFYVDKQTGKELHFREDKGDRHISSNIVTGLLQDRDGRIWVATDHGGLQIINKEDFSMDHVREVPGAANSLSQNSITAMMKDESGTIWVGTFKEGINYYHPDLFQFRLFRHNPLDPGGLPANDIDCFAEDDEGNLYIGTNGNGLIYYDRENADFSVFRAQPENPDSLSHDVIVSLLYDSQDRLWIGTYYGGLNCYDGETFKRYMHDPDDAGSLADNRVWKILEDSRGNIWVGTLGGGLDLYDENKDRFLHYEDGDVNSVNSDFILTMYEDRDHDIWIGTSNGINVYDRSSGRFSHIAANPGKKNALSHHVVLSIIQDRRGLMWIGTRNGLNLYDPETERFRLFLERDGLPDNNILNLLEDDQGNIWMSTLNGLSRAQISGEGEDLDVSFTNFDLLDGIQGREFNEHSAFKTSRGELLFGGPDGFNMFRPEEIEKSPRTPEVLLTGLRLFNKKVEVGDEVNNRPVLENPLFLSDSLVLRHNQNVFSLEFAGTGYFHPERVRYQYKLENFNDTWVSTDASNRLATYTNLNPGTYQFRVRAMVGDKGQPGTETTLTVVVNPPFYATSYAYVIYFLLFTALVISMGFTIRRRERIKYERQQELMEHRRLHEMDAMKIRFFTNISHEFRTPLTLIITPLEKLVQEVQDAHVREQLRMVWRNARRLLVLVNQLLDFRKLEVQGIELQKSVSDVVAFVNDVALSFSDLFASKSIRFSVSSSVEKLNMAFDPDKLEKILFNLLSNAYKYSGERGEVDLNLKYINEESTESTSVEKPVLEIVVRDSGIGISPEMQERVFDRFFQSGTDSSGHAGSGIGLSLTREFVRLHGGVISVKSSPGQGSEFIVELPVRSEEDVHESSLVESEISQGRESRNQEVEAPAGTDDQKPVLLIVDDNEDLRFYLKENLGHAYRVLEAIDGMEGQEKATSVYPDVIVSDIMMPRMDGVELCRKLKNESKTSHIPVILLTAKVSSDEEIEGLGAGADDYITKPFNYEVLALKISKQIELREQLRERLKQKHFDISPGEIGITSLDEKFMQKAARYVEKNLADTELSVEKFSREMGVSRGHLYNKIVALTGKTPTAFIRIMRLKRAAQLLGKSQQTVSEIAYQVGFNDPKYFSRYFKEEYGVTPSEYARRVMRSES